MVAESQLIQGQYVAVQTLISEVDDARSRYHRLLLLVGPLGSGKSQELKSLAETMGWPMINVNQVIVEGLLELDTAKRAVGCSSVLRDAIAATDSDTVVLDNLEVLFEEHLRQDPLRLLQTLSRNTTLVASWPGHYDGRSLTFAEPNHRDYRKYSEPQAHVVTVEQT